MVAWHNSRYLHSNVWDHFRTKISPDTLQGSLSGLKVAFTAHGPVQFPEAQGPIVWVPQTRRTSTPSVQDNLATYQSFSCSEQRRIHKSLSTLLSQRRGGGVDLSSNNSIPFLISFHKFDHF